MFAGRLSAGGTLASSFVRRSSHCAGVVSGCSASEVPLGVTCGVVSSLGVPLLVGGIVFSFGDLDELSVGLADRANVAPLTDPGLEASGLEVAAGDSVGGGFERAGEPPD